jgi:hypothetical protein
MTVGTYHAALEKQHAMNLNTIGTWMQTSQSTVQLRMRQPPSKQ